MQDGVSVVIWQVLMQKKTSLVFTEIMMNSLFYQDFLGNNCVPLKNELMGQNLVLLQNNVSIRKSVSSSEWLLANNIKTSDILS